MTYKQINVKGFTLVEMLLVMVIIGMMIYAGIGYIQQRTQQMRMDRTALQMQQFLNSAMSYYVDNGKWPTDLSTIYGIYTPPGPYKLVSGAKYPINPWGQVYNTVISPVTTSSSLGQSQPLYYVWSPIIETTPGLATAEANTIAGMLPLAYTSSDYKAALNTLPDQSKACDAKSTGCAVVTGVNIPGQNLNNANAVTFAGLYKEGGCVPVPQCPVDNSGKAMTPEIMVIPVSVSGVNDAGSTNVYPISSFTAYATSDVPNKTPTGTSPPFCGDASYTGHVYPTDDQDCTKNATVNSSNVTAYWRVCLQVVTEKGDVSLTNTGTGANLWGQYATLLAITRCAITNEPSGSAFTVYSN